jgi:hypothetical protein
MLSSHHVVFEDYVPNTTTVYTDNVFDERLGRHDQLAIQCIVNEQNAAGGIRVQMLHSNDGRHWMAKYAGTGEISASDNVPATGTVSLAGFDQGATPSFRFVRLAITLVSPCTRAHVKINVATRDAR